ncbi:epoxide hydrolase family protein [Chryseobacterium paridis]|uniref:Epoxide hydrolase n=1 Tax=Chryseobacterium paridis TaxID=2800328 RepID=A0ABS1FUR8_9FLAO|nr:epoxide hydrolase family protein [Chryseobacterium paridis]MBK1896159.1 epoxide hydrolase [Chryseobacterium paridis]
MKQLTRRELIKKSSLAFIGISLPLITKTNHLFLKMPTPNNMIKPFSVNVPQQVLEDLKLRLNLTRWPDQITGSDWNYGTDLTYLKELTTYWQTTFDWRKVEAEINSYPNFMADIDGHQIHFMHIKGKGKRSIPLIITHGWPGSFLEMMKLIPLLTEDPDFSFNLVIPSVPGFGFSGKITDPGCNSEFVADIWHKLMLELGYPRYGAQGGDIGSGISTWLSLKYSSHMMGLHLNYISGSYKPYLADDEKLSDEVLAFQKTGSEWSAREGAYAHMHATKPLTAAYGLNDSPVGLCAWIVEKFKGWSDNGGYIENTFTKDELLANVTLYWITQTIHSSMRIYNENSKKPLVFKENDYVKVPVAFAQFPKELPTPPQSYVEKGFNIQSWTRMPAGGHFAAVEQPELLSKDIINFFSGLD